MFKVFKLRHDIEICIDPSQWVNIEVKSPKLHSSYSLEFDLKNVLVNYYDPNDYRSENINNFMKQNGL